MIILLSLVINNSILLYVTNIENHSESNVEKGDHYKLIAHDYYVSFVNTVVVINDSFSVYGCLKIINSTLIFNTTRDRIITIYCYCDNVIMENSILKTVDRNVSFFKIISVYWTLTEPIKNETIFVYITVSDNVGIVNVTAVLNTSGSTWTEKLLSYGNGTYCLVLTELGDIDSVFILYNSV